MTLEIVKVIADEKLKSKNWRSWMKSGKKDEKPIVENEEKEQKRHEIET